MTTSTKPQALLWSTFLSWYKLLPHRVNLLLIAAVPLLNWEVPGLSLRMAASTTSLRQKSIVRSSQRHWLDNVLYSLRYFLHVSLPLLALPLILAYAFHFGDSQLSIAASLLSDPLYISAVSPSGAITTLLVFPWLLPLPSAGVPASLILLAVCVLAAYLLPAATILYVTRRKPSQPSLRLLKEATIRSSYLHTWTLGVVVAITMRATIFFIMSPVPYSSLISLGLSSLLIDLPLLLYFRSALRPFSVDP